MPSASITSAPQLFGVKLSLAKAAILLLVAEAANSSTLGELEERSEFVGAANKQAALTSLSNKSLLIQSVLVALIRVDSVSLSSSR